jgi:hypothetical protein
MKIIDWLGLLTKNYENNERYESMFGNINDNLINFNICSKSTVIANCKGLNNCPDECKPKIAC